MSVIDPSTGLSVAMEAMLPYTEFYRRFGIRRPIQLVAPTLPPVESLELPFGSILHYVGDDEGLYGIPQDDYLLRNVQRIIMVNHHATLTDDAKGGPRSAQIPAPQLSRQYHRANRKTRPMTRPEAVMRDKRTVIVENYALLPHLFRYMPSIYRGYNRWWNIQAVLWDQIAKYGALEDHQQFLLCGLPNELPTKQEFDRFSAQTAASREMLNAFRTPNALFLMEIWKWLGPNRASSVIARAPTASLKNLNLIWIESGRWMVFNLNQLDLWRKPTKDEVAAGADENQGVINPAQMQRRFLRLMMHLLELRSVAEVEDAPAADANTAAPETAESEVDAEIKPITLKIPEHQDGGQKSIRLTVNADIERLPEFQFIEETDANIDAIDERISEELDALSERKRELVEASSELESDDRTETQVANRGSNAKVNYIPLEISDEDAIMNKVDALVDAEALTGGDYRKFRQLSTAAQRLKDPYGVHEKLIEHLNIDPKVMELSKEDNIPDHPSIVDKSMLRSRLQDFDKQYIKNVMKKDVLSMVLAVQQAGVAIEDYTVEQDENAMGHVEIHTVKLVPVQGKPSTIMFRIPAVSEDGTYRRDGVRYRLRKQRGD